MVSSLGLTEGFGFETIGRNLHMCTSKKAICICLFVPTCSNTGILERKGVKEHDSY